MHYVIYFILAVFATTVGSLTGMGGGVIIKPLMDFLGHYDVLTIGVISSVTVFSMAVVSVMKQIKSGAQIPFKTAIPLAAGSVAGGFIGQKVLELAVDALNADSVATIVQNAILAVLIVCVIIYIKNKNHIKGKQLDGIAVSLLVGVFLGFCSSFLGVGGGPINVALIIFLFSYSTKTATICSIVIILFAQVSKLVTNAFTTGFADFDLSVLPLMVLGAIMGGFIGAELNKKLSEKHVENAFMCVQIFVLAITVLNIVKSCF